MATGGVHWLWAGCKEAGDTLALSPAVGGLRRCYILSGQRTRCILQEVSEWHGFGRHASPAPSARLGPAGSQHQHRARRTRRRHRDSAIETTCTAAVCLRPWPCRLHSWRFDRQRPACTRLKRSDKQVLCHQRPQRRITRRWFRIHAWRWQWRAAPRHAGAACACAGACSCACWTVDSGWCMVESGSWSGCPSAASRAQRQCG